MVFNSSSKLGKWTSELFGAHICSLRLKGVYTHHGIYLKKRWVIHYSGKGDSLKTGPISLTSIDDFAQNGEFAVIPHKEEYSRKEVIARAFYKFGESRYLLPFNNCEHFATWCHTGKHISFQSERVFDSLFPPYSAVGSRLINHTLKEVNRTIGDWVNSEAEAVSESARLAGFTEEFVTQCLKHFCGKKAKADKFIELPS